MYLEAFKSGRTWSCPMGPTVWPKRSVCSRMPSQMASTLESRAWCSQRPMLQRAGRGSRNQAGSGEQSVCRFVSFCTTGSSYERMQAMRMRCLSDKAVQMEVVNLDWLALGDSRYMMGSPEDTTARIIAAAKGAGWTKEMMQKREKRWEEEMLKVRDLCQIHKEQIEEARQVRAMQSGRARQSRPKPAISKNKKRKDILSRIAKSGARK